MGTNRFPGQADIDDSIARYGQCRNASSQDQILSRLAALLRKKRSLGHQLPAVEQEFLDMIAEEQHAGGYHRIVAALVVLHYLCWIWFVWLRDPQPTQTARAAGAGVGVSMVPHGDALIGPWMIPAGVSVVLGLLALPVCRPPVPLGLVWVVAVSIFPIAVIMALSLAAAFGWHVLMS